MKVEKVHHFFRFIVYNWTIIVVQGRVKMGVTFIEGEMTQVHCGLPCVEMGQTLLENELL